MAEENVELLHRFIEGFNEGDLEACIVLVDPETEFITRTIAVEGGGFRGAEGVRAAFESYRDAFPDFEVEIVDTFDLDELLLIQGTSEGHWHGQCRSIRAGHLDGPAMARRKAASLARPQERGGLAAGRCRACDSHVIPVSEENLELLREFVERFNEGDVEALLPLADPDVEFRTLTVALEGGTFRGLDGLRQAFAAYREAFPDFELEIMDTPDLEDLILMRARVKGHGTGSAAPFEQGLWIVHQWRDGKLLRSYSYRTKGEALKAAAELGDAE